MFLSLGWKRMMTSQTNKTTAFNQLLRLAKNPSICFWEWEDDYHKGGQCREVDWQYPVLCYQAGKNKSDILNDVLYRLTVADFPTTAKQMDEAIASAKGRAGSKRMIWSRRAAQYEENINSGDPMKVAEVVRDLRRHNPTDTMTFSARQLYLRALERMAQEFAVLHKMDVDAASEKIEDMLGVPKEIDLNAVDIDEEEVDESADNEE